MPLKLLAALHILLLHRCHLLPCGYFCTAVWSLSDVLKSSGLLRVLAAAGGLNCVAVPTVGTMGAL